LGGTKGLRSIETLAIASSTVTGGDGDHKFTVDGGVEEAKILLEEKDVNRCKKSLRELEITGSRIGPWARNHNRKESSSQLMGSGAGKVGNHRKGINPGNFGPDVHAETGRDLGISLIARLETAWA
jgi:hypothetical protein